jgi:outer membrane protein assembly factor BamB
VLLAAKSGTSSARTNLRFRQIWHRRLADYSQGGLALENGRLLTVVGQDRLECYRTDGTLAWSRRVESSMPMLPSTRGSVYVDGSTILRIDVTTGEVLAWREVEESFPHLFIKDDMLTFSTEMPNRVVALDLDTLETRLEAEAVDGGHLQDGFICEADSDGEIKLRDPHTGRAIWHWYLPTTAGGYAGHFHYGPLYCRLNGVERIAIDVQTGDIKWRVIEGDPEAPSPPRLHVFHGVVGALAIAGSDRLSAYDIETGAVRWRIPLQVTTPDFDGTRAVVDANRSLCVLDVTGAADARSHLRRESFHPHAGSRGNLSHRAARVAVADGTRKQRIRIGARARAPLDSCLSGQAAGLGRGPARRGLADRGERLNGTPSRLQSSDHRISMRSASKGEHRQCQKERCTVRVHIAAFCSARVA